MPIIEIFKTGRWKAMEGQEISFSEADLKKTAAAYSPAVFHSPVVIGHPKTDDPAWGWAKSLSYADGKLMADVDDLEPSFAEAVKNKRYAKISPSFYALEHPNNPVPGTYYLRHIGFLGATAPAVKGLKPVSFACTEALTFDFSEAEQKQDQKSETKQPANDMASFAAREAGLIVREKALVRKENEQFLDSLISDGRFLPVLKTKTLDFMEHLDAQTVSFSEKTSAFRDILSALPKAIELKELSKEPSKETPKTASFAAPTGYEVPSERLEMHQAILSYQEKHEGLSYAQAAIIVEKEKTHAK